jgi:hypothetical protein
MTVVGDLPVKPQTVLIPGNGFAVIAGGAVTQAGLRSLRKKPGCGRVSKDEFYNVASWFETAQERLP